MLFYKASKIFAAVSLFLVLVVITRLPATQAEVQSLNSNINLASFIYPIDIITPSTTSVDFQSAKPALVFVYVDWCHYCQTQKEVIDELEQDYGDQIEFIRIDGRQNPKMMDSYEVTGFPYMYVLGERGGEHYIYREFEGFTEKDILKLSLNSLLDEVPTNDTDSTGVIDDISSTYLRSETDQQLQVAAASCGNGIVDAGENCDDGNTLDGDGCSSDCRSEDLQVYLVPYVGDIDGSIDSDWYYFYKMLWQWYNANDIPAGFSFYPRTMNDQEYNQILADMYSSPTIELITKGESEIAGKPLDKMSYAEVKALIESWQNRFVHELEQLGYSDVEVPIAYNQQLGRFTAAIRDAIKDLGFKIYFEQFESEYGYLESLPDLDIMQYTIPLTVSGRPGPEESFKQPEQVIQELLDFEHEMMLYIDDIKVVSLMVHQQDFLIDETSSVLNRSKWDTYTSLLLSAKNDVRIRLINPSEIYYMRRDQLCGDGVLDIGEECDDGNTVDSDGCSRDCKSEKSSVCGNGILEEDEECDDGNLMNGDRCSATCGIERIVLLGMDDIQSNYFEDVQEVVVQAHMDSNIPVTLGVIPGQVTEPLLSEIKKWDRNALIEIAQHDFTHDTVLIGEDYDTQYKYLKKGSDLFEAWDIHPNSYVPGMGQADDTTVKVVKDLGFHTLYDGLPIGITSSIDPLTITDQLHLCEENKYGTDCLLKEHSVINTEVEHKIEQYGVALIIYHMQDFAHKDGSVNIGKIEEFVNIAERLRHDRFTLMTVEQYYQYKMRGKPATICQYASFASATSEHNETRAINATGAPDAPKYGECSGTNSLSDFRYTWGPSNWDVVTQLVLKYDTPVYPNSLTIFGDYEMCWESIWLENSMAAKRRRVFNGNDTSCISTHEVDVAFPVDTVILETCGWSWTMTDAVQLCGTLSASVVPSDTDDGSDDDSESEIISPSCGNGKLEEGEECDDGNLLDSDGCDSMCNNEVLDGKVCQYAVFADASAETPGYEAIYARSAPDSDGICDTTPSMLSSWEKRSWNDVSDITLTYTTPLYPDSVIVYGDYELCIDRVWLWRDSYWYLVWDVALDTYEEGECIATFNFNSLDFRTDKIRLQTCGWRWSAIDAVEFCGTTRSFPEITVLNPVQDIIIDPSQQTTYLEISTDIVAECSLSFQENFNFTDGTKMMTTDGIEHSYTLDTTRNQDTLNIYYKCKGTDGQVNPYSVMHRLYVRETDIPFIELCDWYDCAQGAASISIDDGYHTTIDQVKATCREALENHGLKGTYYLAYTGIYTEEDWQLWRDVYTYGHEIGGHMGDCSYGRDQGNYSADLQMNLDDMITHIGMSRDELMTFAWPCGVTSADYTDWISDYYLFQRGYHVNLIESPNPEDMQYIKSVNSIGFGDNPPDYYLLADVAENWHGWVNYVYHDSCDNPEVFDYLLTKDLWVETIAKVSKYIYERRNVSVQDIRETSAGVAFNVVNDLDPQIFDQELTFKIYTDNGDLDSVKVNGQEVEFTSFNVGNQSYTKFDLIPAKNVKVDISGEISGLTFDIDEESSTTNWLLISIIAAMSVLVSGIILFVLVHRRRSRNLPT
jgi:cysteine-rich repeat protein